METKYKTFLILKVTLISLVLLFVTSGCERSLTDSIAAETEKPNPN